MTTAVGGASDALEVVVQSLPSEALKGILESGRRTVNELRENFEAKRRRILAERIVPVEPPSGSSAGGATMEEFPKGALEGGRGDNAEAGAGRRESVTRRLVAGTDITMGDGSELVAGTNILIADEESPEEKAFGIRNATTKSTEEDSSRAQEPSANPSQEDTSKPIAGVAGPPVPRDQRSRPRGVSDPVASASRTSSSASSRARPRAATTSSMATPTSSSTNIARGSRSASYARTPKKNARVTSVGGWGSSGQGQTGPGTGSVAASTAGSQPVGRHHPRPVPSNPLTSPVRIPRHHVQSGSLPQSPPNFLPQSETETLRGLLLESEYKNQDLMREIASRERDLETKIDTLKSQLVSLSDDYSKLISTNTYEKAARAAAETDSASCRGQIELLHEDLAVKAEQLTHKAFESSLLQAARDEAQDLSRKLANQRHQLDESLTHCETLGKKLIDAQDKLRDEKSKYEGLLETDRQKQNELRQTLRETNARLDAAKLDTARLEREVHALQQSKVELEAGRVAQKTIADNALADVEYLKDLLTTPALRQSPNQVERANEVADRDRKLNEFERRESLLELRCSKLEADIADLRQQENDRSVLLEREELNAALSRSMQTFSRVSNSYVEEIEAENSMLKSQLDQLVGEHKGFMENSARNGDRLAVSYSELLDDRARLAESLAWSQSTLAETQQKLSTLTNTDADNEQLRDKLRIERDRTAFHAGHAESLGNQLKDANAQLAEFRSQLQVQHKHACNADKIADTRYRDLTSELEHRNAQITGLLAKIQELHARNYRPVAGDPIDSVVARWVNGYEPAVPFFRVSQGVYMFGRRQVNCQISNEKPVFRVGGGFLSFEEFLDRFQSEEVEKMIAPEALAKNQQFAWFKQQMAEELREMRTAMTGGGEGAREQGNGGMEASSFNVSVLSDASSPRARRG